MKATLFHHQANMECLQHSVDHDLRQLQRQRRTEAPQPITWWPIRMDLNNHDDLCRHTSVQTDQHHSSSSSSLCVRQGDRPSNNDAATKLDTVRSLERSSYRISLTCSVYKRRVNIQSHYKLTLQQIWVHTEQFDRPWSPWSFRVCFCFSASTSRCWVEQEFVHSAWSAFTDAVRN